MPNNRLQIEIVHDNQQSMSEKKPNPAPPAAAAPKEYSPGDGLRSLRTTGLFKAVNYELYVKPVSVTDKFLNLEWSYQLHIVFILAERSDYGHWASLSPRCYRIYCLYEV